MGNHRSVTQLLGTTLTPEVATPPSLTRPLVWTPDTLTQFEQDVRQADMDTGFRYVSEALGLDHYWDEKWSEGLGLPSSGVVAETSLTQHGWEEITSQNHPEMLPVFADPGVSNKRFWRSPDGQIWMEKDDKKVTAPNEAVVARMFHHLAIPGVPVWAKTGADHRTTTLQPLLPDVAPLTADSNFNRHPGWASQYMAQRLAIWSVGAGDQHVHNYVQPRQGLPYRMAIDLQKSLRFTASDLQKTPEQWHDESFNRLGWEALSPTDHALAKSKVLEWAETRSDHPPTLAELGLTDPLFANTYAKAESIWKSRVQSLPHVAHEWLETL